MTVALFVVLIDACLGSQCETFRLPQDAPSRQTCDVTSPMVVAQWAGDHPGWTLVRWSCARDDERGA